MIIAIAILVVFAVFALYRHIAMVNKLMNDSHKKIMSSLDSIKTFFTVTLIDKISGAFQDDSTIDDNDDMSDS